MSSISLVSYVIFLPILRLIIHYSFDARHCHCLPRLHICCHISPACHSSLLCFPPSLSFHSCHFISICRRLVYSFFILHISDILVFLLQFEAVFLFACCSFSSGQSGYCQRRQAFRSAAASPPAHIGLEYAKAGLQPQAAAGREGASSLAAGLPFG